MRVERQPRLRRHLRLHHADRAARPQGQGRRRGDERHPQRHLRRPAHRGPGRRRRPGQVGRRRRAAAVPGARPCAAGRPRGLPDARARCARSAGCPPRPARSRCGCRSACTAATSTSSWWATRTIHRELLDQRSRRQRHGGDRGRRRGRADRPEPAARRHCCRPAARRAAAATAGCCAPSRRWTTSRASRRQPSSGSTRRRAAAADPRPPAQRDRPSPSTARSRSRSCSSPGRTSCSRDGRPEALAEALDEVVRNVQRACADHEVTFFETDINRDGGKIMLTAGAPRSADHDEERMLRVARLVLDRAGRLPLRIGVNRGPVFAGDFGPPFRRTYSVKGDAINLAARVMGKAAPGQAARHHGGRRTLADRLPHDRAAAVHGQGQVEAGPGRRDRRGSSAPASEERMAVPLIGREPTRWLCLGACAGRRPRPGAAGWSRSSGEPGIGKSRLVEELLPRRRRRARWCERPREEYESSTAYFPFRRLLREVLGVPADAAPDEVAGRLVDRVVGRTRRTCVTWLPLLGVPMDVELEPTRATRELDEQFRKDRLEDVVSELPVLGAAHLDGARVRGRAPDGRRVRGPAAAAGGRARQPPVAAAGHPP